MVDTFELSELSRKLNAKSDTLNKLIASVNARLLKMNFGTEVWLLDPIEAGDPDDREYDTDTRVDPRRDAMLLGYCEVEDTWQLAAKKATLVEKMNVHYGPSYEVVTNSEEPIPLLKTTRIIRLKATRLIPGLLEEIKSEAERLLKSIDEAEAQAGTF